MFAALVPLAVHQAQQASAARCSEAAAAEVAALRDATQLLNSVLASLSLPACVEQAADSGALPDSIRAKVRRRPRAHHMFRRALGHFTNDRFVRHRPRRCARRAGWRSCSG